MVLVAFLVAAPSYAQVQAITGITANYDNISDTSDDYSTLGAGTAGFPNTTTYNMRFNQGTQNNLVLESFNVNTDEYLYVLLADEINLERVDNATTTGRHHIIFFQQQLISGTNIDLRPGYKMTMNDALRSPVINRGADNVFANQGDGNGNHNNLQRIDYLFTNGLPVYNNLDRRGFLVMERGGNDRFKIAAITALDSNGKPSAFTDPVTVLETNWGPSGYSFATLVTRGYTEDGGELQPSANVGSQPIAGVYISFEAIGLQLNDIIYGYSLAANDVTNDGDFWTEVDNPAYFPTDTSVSGAFGGLDLLSGGMIFYHKDLEASIGGRMWDDLDRNGIQDVGEPGIPNRVAHLYDNADTLVAITSTNADGDYLFEGIGAGTFYVRFFLPDSYEFTAQYVGSDITLDSNADPVTGQSELITVTVGDSALTIDAGMYLLSADLAVEKVVDDDEPLEGQQITFTVTVTNNGGDNASDIEITDILPAGLGFDSATPSQGTYNHLTGIWAVGDLAVANSATLTIAVTVDAGTGGASLTNTATVTNLYEEDPDPDNDEDSAVVLVQGADIEIIKVADRTNVQEGDTVSYTITVTNGGPSNVTGVEVTEQLAAGITYVGDTPSHGVYNSGTGLWTVGDLSVGASATLVIECTVDTGTAGATIANTAQITASDLPDPNPANDEATAAITVSALRIDKSASPSLVAPPGSTLTYTIEIENVGSVPQTGINVTDAVPTGTTYVNGSVSVDVVPPVGSGGTETLVFDSNDTFTVPAGVTSITVEAWGAGGGGGKVSTDGTNAGGGGGGGGYARSVLAVNPDDSFPVTVGLGGAAATPGGDSWFDSVTTVFADGGSGGGSDATVGSGGSANIGNQATFVGGAGGTGHNAGGGGNRRGGGGGGSATSTANGGDGQNGGSATGGAGGIGEGNGGDGTQGGTTGNPGNAPGGGGGGGGNNAIGGAGADGRVRITYDLPSGAGTTGAPPDLADGWTLEPGSIMTITFEVVVDDPAAGDEVCNVAFVQSVESPAAVSAEVCVSTLSIIDAVNDAYGPVNGFVGNANIGNALDNDTLNGVAVDVADVTLAVITAASHPGVVLNETTGVVSVAAGTPARSYTIVYEICDVLDSANCDTATITVLVIIGPTAVDDESLDNIPGAAVVVDVLANDSEGSAPLDPATVQIVGTASPGDSLVVPGEGVWSVNTTTGEITFTPESGYTDDPTPISYTVDDENGLASNAASVTVTYDTCVTIEAWVFLEGAAINPGDPDDFATEMRTDLNGLRLLPGQSYEDPFSGLPVYQAPGQPYSGMPWLYIGAEGDLYDSGGDWEGNGDAGYPATVVDWVLVSLRETPDGSGGALCQAAALLHNDGRIEFVGATFDCCSLDLDASYYLVVEHRNHLIIMSHEPVAIVGGVLTYDFRTQQSYTNDPHGFGLFARQKEIVPGLFAMYGGNGEQVADVANDTDIDSNDRTYWESDNGYAGEYRTGDYNMDGDPNFKDIILWEQNNGWYTSVPRD